MNKKILLGTLVTSSVLTASLLAPKTMAAVIEGNGEKLTSNVNNNTISIVFPSSNPRGNRNALTRKMLVELVEGKYNTGAVKSVVSASGKEVTSDNAKVGTGATVTLKSGTELKVVLFGDVDGNGSVNDMDVLKIQQHSLGDVIKDSYVLKAGDVVSTGDRVDTLNDVDALRVQYYAINEVGTESRKTLVNQEKYPQEIVNADDKIKNVIEVLKEVEGNNDLFSLSFDEDSNVVTFGFVNNDAKLGDFIGKGTDLMTRLAEQLKNPDVKDIVVKVNDKEVTLNANSDVLDAAKTLLKNVFGDDLTLESLSAKSVKDLFDKSLEVKINMNAQADDNNQNLNSVTYTLKFNTTDAEAKMEEIFEDLNEVASNDIYRLEFATEGDANKVKVKINDTKKETKISDLSGTGLIAEAKELLNEILDDESYSEDLTKVESVEVKFGDKTQTVSPQDLLNGGRQKLNEILKNLGLSDEKKLSDLFSQNLEVKFNVKEETKDELLAKYGLESFDFTFDFEDDTTASDFTTTVAAE